MRWLDSYNPALPITVVLLDDSGDGQDFFQIAAADGPLFVTQARLPLSSAICEEGLIVDISSIRRSGFFDEADELLEHFQRARIVLNDIRTFVTPNDTMH